jgi:hypothetical protein
MAWIAPIAAAVGEAAGAAGSAIGSAASAVGSTVGSAASTLGSLFGGEGAAGAAEAAGAAAPEAAGVVGGILPEAAAAAAPESFLGTIGSAIQGALPGPTGIGSLTEGLQSLFGGSPEAAPGFVGPPSALAGPAVVGPGFVGGFVQGLTGQYAPAAAASGGSAAGGGLGQLVSFLNSLHGSAGAPPRAPMGPIVRLGGMPTAPFTQLIPNTAQSNIETGPIMKLLAHL